MTEFTEEKLAELKAVAEGATPGPWELVAGGEYMPATGLVVAPDDGGVSPGNAAHIATFDPPTVTALIAALEAKNAGVESLAKEALHALPDNRLGTLSSYIATLEQERDEARAEKWRKRSGQETLAWIDHMKRADRAEAALERVREAATEVTNQERNRGRTHYESCWQHHLHCLAAKIIHETGDDDE